MAGLLIASMPIVGVVVNDGSEFCEDSSQNCARSQLTAILLGGTGATGREVLKELNSNDQISKIIFISRRPIAFTDMPKVYINTIMCYKLHKCSVIA